jgi:hypothetical protein
MPRLARTSALLGTLALLALAPAASLGRGAGTSPRAKASATSCHLSRYEQRHLGTTYVLSLSVRITTCRNGKRLVRAYHACRHRHGRAGRCSAVYGYSCSERRFNKSRFSYDAKARCAKGSRRVWHTYTQNL